jgi:hypothetical protein
MIKSITKTQLQIKIAFGCKMRVGKDEACSYLLGKYGGKKISFASKIYDIQTYAQKICGFKQEKDRQFLQYIGTEWARKKDPDIWIRLAMQDTPENENVFLSDLRFKNEFNALKKEGWFCVKIVRSSISSDILEHQSEIDLDAIDDKEWDFVVKNNDGLEDFYKKLDTLYFNIWRNSVEKERTKNIDTFF